MAAGAVRTFDPKKVSFIWGGYPITGFPDGTFITVKRTEKKLFEKKKGAAGDVERINKDNYDHTIDFSIMQTSDTNDILSAAVILDQESNMGSPEVIIKDNGGTTLFTAAACWIAEDADIEVGTSLTPRKWVMETGPAVKVVGGNTSLLSAISSLLGG